MTAPSDRVRILLADDHPMAREAISGYLRRAEPELAITSCGSLDEALAAIREDGAYNLAMLDLDMPGMDGLSGVEKVRNEFPALPVVMISGTAQYADVSQAIALGARGFLPKVLPGEVIVNAVRVILAGGTYIPVEYMKGVAAGVSASISSTPEASADTLTPREFEVLNLIAAGHSNKEIARELNLREVTIKFHSRQIFRKMDVKNRAQAVARAIGMNLISRD